MYKEFKEYLSFVWVLLVKYTIYNKYVNNVTITGIQK